MRRTIKQKCSKRTQKCSKRTQKCSKRTQKCSKRTLKCSKRTHKCSKRTHKCSKRKHKKRGGTLFTWFGRDCRGRHCPPPPPRRPPPPPLSQYHLTQNKEWVLMPPHLVPDNEPCGTWNWYLELLREDKNNLIDKRDGEVELWFGDDIERYKTYLSETFEDKEDIRIQTGLIELQYNVQNKTIWLEQAIIFKNAEEANCTMDNNNVKVEVKKLVDIRYDALGDPGGDNRFNPRPVNKPPHKEVATGNGMLPREYSSDGYSAAAEFSEKGGTGGDYLPGR
jgi:hypothetical protein